MGRYNYCLQRGSENNSQSLIVLLFLILSSSVRGPGHQVHLTIVASQSRARGPWGVARGVLTLMVAR